MWVLLLTRVRAWLLFRVVLPTVRTLLHDAARRAQRTHPGIPATRALVRADAVLSRAGRRRPGRRGARTGWRRRRQ